MADINEENIDGQLRMANHILYGCNKFDDGMVELSTHPSVPRLVVYLIPVEELWDLIRQVTHVTSPAVIIK
jgi:hypothetical protein